MAAGTSLRNCRSAGLTTKCSAHPVYLESYLLTGVRSKLSLNELPGRSLRARLNWTEVSVRLFAHPACRKSAHDLPPDTQRSNNRFQLHKRGGSRATQNLRPPLRTASNAHSRPTSRTARPEPDRASGPSQPPLDMHRPLQTLDITRPRTITAQKSTISNPTASHCHTAYYRRSAAPRHAQRLRNVEVPRR